MKKGQLIVNCLKMLNDNNGQEIDYQMVSGLDEYKDRTTVIVPSINRALQRLSQLGKIPVKVMTLTYDAKEKVINIVDDGKEFAQAIDPDKYNVISLDASKIMEISNIIFQDRRLRTYTNINNYISGNLLMLPPLENGEKYVIDYRPIIEDIKDDDPDTMDLDYPNYILDMIPYFVKGELFEEDDPQLAIIAANKFEALADSIKERNQSRLRDVVDVYGLY